MTSLLLALLILCLVTKATTTAAFQQPLNKPFSRSQSPTRLYDSEEEEQQRSKNKASFWKENNPLNEISDFFAHFDDVIDDFMNKRMGNGELFYGARKYKPSGRPNMDGKYSGMGMSDRVRIDTVREYKEKIKEKRRLNQDKKR